MDGLSTVDTTPAASLLGRIPTLADPLRCRMLQLLEGAELTVSELGAILQLPQSTTSRHLKVLTDDGWLRVRREGTRRLYSAGDALRDGSSATLWELLRPEIEALPAVDEDRRRLASVLEERLSTSQQFFSAAAGDWARLRRELFGGRFDLEAMLALLDPESTVGDLGAGTGETAATLAPFVGRVIAVDASAAMLKAAERRLAGYENVELRRGRLESLPIDDDAVDLALLALVLHYQPEPEAAIAEAARVLRPGGRLLIVDMNAHDRDEYRQRMGHVWLGFEPRQIEAWCEAAGLAQPRRVALTPDPAAKGPALFAACATKQ